jgi:hypothetical protein
MRMPSPSLAPAYPPMTVAGTNSSVCPAAYAFATASSAVAAGVPHAGLPDTMTSYACPTRSQRLSRSSA